MSKNIEIEQDQLNQIALLEKRITGPLNSVKKDTPISFLGIQQQIQPSPNLKSQTEAPEKNNSGQDNKSQSQINSVNFNKQSASKSQIKEKMETINNVKNNFAGISKEIEFKNKEIGVQSNLKITDFFPNLGMKTSTNKENISNKTQTLNNPEETQFQDVRKLQEYMQKQEQKIADRDKKLKEFEATFKQQENQIKQQEKYFSQIEEKNKKSLMQTMQIFGQKLLELENSARFERQRQIREQKNRVGEIVQQRDGTRFVDTWIDGYEVKKLKIQQQIIKTDLEDVELKKKQLKNMKKSKKEMNDDSNSNNMGEFLYCEQKERLAQQAMQLNIEEEEVKQQLNLLELEKIILVNKIKLDFEERNCRFGKHDLSIEDQWPRIGPLKKFQILALIGKGGYSEVYKAFDLEDNQYRAIKIHQLNPNWTEQTKNTYITHASREMKIHAELDHPNIVKCFGYTELENDNDSFGTILEYCEGQDLSIYLKQHKQIPEKEAKMYIKQIASGLRYMHNFKPQKVIHYDLITDFGLCKVMDDQATRIELTSQGVGTYWYLPPECFKQQDDQEKISSKVDIWSLGVIMYEMLYAARPFGSGMSQERILQEGIILKATKVNFPIKPTVSKESQEFIRKCLTYEQEQRWDINELYTSTYTGANKK